MNSLKFSVILESIKLGYRSEYRTLVFEPVHINYVDSDDKDRRYEAPLVPVRIAEEYEVGKRYWFTITENE